MVPKSSWLMAAACLMTGCQAPSGNVAEPTHEADTAIRSFRESLSRAFSKDASDDFTNAPIMAAAATGGLARSIVATTCGLSDNPGGGLLLGDMTAEQQDACAIWGMAATTMAKDDQGAVIGATVDGDIAITTLWSGQAASKGRTLPATLLEAQLNIVNPLDGFRGSVCVRKLSVVDAEFKMERSIMYRSCAAKDMGKIGEAMKGAGITDVPQEYRASAETTEPSAADDQATAPAADPTAAAEEQNPAQEQSAHDQAAADNKLSTQGITAAWNAIDVSRRAEILPLQRAWIKAKDANCSIDAASASLDQVEQDTARLRCDTAANTSRIDWLKQYLPQ
ncbi:DUF1311 domain-containing protein [Sphingobium sp. AP49]|uniref:DUF1311 domain-containing protein n=1 Tax=Sphingobium sp. AP49 TaxID=1144307 RepID=UPI00026ED752|nr:DUF1311 domain-containing protein [Sphingobium sp. AP49]WHO38601.1 DUF1311 domain-containing protein [Sphingobium sp. AP49]